MKIVVLCPYPSDRAPSQRLKFEQYYASWRAAGHEIDVRPFWDESAWSVLYQPSRRIEKSLALVRGYARRTADLLAALRAHLAYVRLAAAPVGPPAVGQRRHRAGTPIVCDIDELVNRPHGSRHNRVMPWLRGGTKV